VRRAYVALNGYRNDDSAPYLYATDDAGASWRDIGRGLPAAPVNVVREDPENAEVLYVGTDRGVYASLDRGRTWDSLQQNLPNVPVHDLVVHPRERELVAGTHGRSAWIVDVLPVQELGAVRGKAVHVFPLTPLQAQRDWRGRLPRWFDATPYLPEVVGSFWARGDGTATVRVLDADDRPVQRFEVPARAGVNRLVWNAQVDRELALAAETAANDKRAKEAKEPLPAEGALSRTPYAESVRLGHVLYALPGKYKVELALGGETSHTELEIKAPEARKPRIKPEPKVRGKDGWAGAATVVEPHPRARSNRKPRG
jgi:hypothetical protein